ncbi:MAG: hypothetical protein AAFQ28_14615 [Pseudomonadota bacterium]
MARLFLSLVFAATATGTCAFSTPLALQNEGIFFLNFNRGEITGFYNPAGYTSQEVKEVVDWMCSRGRVSDVTENNSQNGLVEIAATCRLSDISGSGRAEIRGRGTRTRFKVEYRGFTNNGRIFRKRRF